MEHVQNVSLDLTGNGRCDSWGFNGKYGMYSLMDANNNEIIDCHIVHVAVVRNSIKMEIMVYVNY